VSASSVPTATFTPTGLVIPLESDILAGVQADYNAAFGGNLNPSASTPQGQLIASTAAIVGDANNVFAEFVSQVDPDIADGMMQDVIGRIYFLDRHPATSTIVQCQCSGVIGATIPMGSQVTDADGNVYASTDAVVIGLGGTVNATFACVETGPVVCPAGAANRIYRAVIGWESVNNAAAGVVGSNVESRSDFEFRRRQSVALNAHGSLASIYAAVFDLDNVTDVYATDNVASVDITKGATNFPLAAHSLYVAVVGGDSNAIAQAIWSKKDLGCNYNGNTEVTVTDDSYSYPKPEYVIKFQRPDPVPILFSVTIARNPLLPADIETLVKNAIINTFSGQDGSPRARIGGIIFASRFYAGIGKLSSVVEILSILVGSDTAAYNSVTMGIDQVPTVSASNITVRLV
jgi:hypothetical protein